MEQQRSMTAREIRALGFDPDEAAAIRDRLNFQPPVITAGSTKQEIEKFRGFHSGVSVEPRVQSRVIFERQ